jgi:DHA1 family tetracycline resistance protein-like MFS transporter
MAERSSAGSMFALAAVMLVAMTGFGIFLPIFPFLGLQTGANATAITWAMGAYSLGQFVAAPFWGRVSDRIGRKPVLIIGLAGSVISYLIIAHAETIYHLGGARLFGGLMAGNAGAAFAAAADLADEKTRARNMGLLGASVGFGFIAGPAIGAALIGNEATAAGFQRICYVAAGFAAAAALVALLLFRETRKAGNSVAEERARSWSLLTHRPVLTFFVALTLITIAAQALLETTFGLWAHAVLQWGPRDVGWALAGMGLMAALLQGGAAGRLARIMGEGRTLALGLMAFVIGFVIIARAGDATMTYVALAVITLGVGLATPALQSLVAAQGDASDLGAVMGLNQSASALGRVMGPAFAGILFSASHAAPYWAGAALMLSALAVSFVALPIVLTAPRKT